MMGECLECGSLDTELVRGDDGHFRKECDECGYTGGPYVSSYGDDGSGGGGQASLGDF